MIHQELYSLDSEVFVLTDRNEPGLSEHLSGVEPESPVQTFKRWWACYPALYAERRLSGVQ